MPKFFQCKTNYDATVVFVNLDHINCIYAEEPGKCTVSFSCEDNICLLCDATDILAAVKEREKERAHD